ncbi:MAG: peptidoglycan bridge formation glycyltransferase FemA/FemB family protein [Chloroflexi bacterium]|nr:peptidoglycan bridge formation glycyltransferase FemA/FemB family protein [Chloroflexota bacterium]
MPIITPSPAAWDSFVAAHPRAHVLQQSAWGTLKSAYGWRALCLAFSASGESERIAAGALLLFRPLPLRLGTMAYLPMGPLLAPDADDSTQRALWTAIHRAARQQRAAFLKWEPGIYTPAETPPKPLALGFRPGAQTIQPPRTILIDIAGTEDALLARMNQGTRRKIRQALKNGVRYAQGTRADMTRFNAMMQATGARNIFGVHAPDYYEKAYDLFVAAGDAALLLAEHEGDTLAGIMVFAKGRTAWYLYGASADVKRNLMASYGVQWAGIQWARARGCLRYDLWGIPDADETTLEAQFETRADGLWGVYGFKRGWGGDIVRSLGAWDYVYNPLVYAAYTLALKYRTQID